MPAGPCLLRLRALCLLLIYIAIMSLIMLSRIIARHFGSSPKVFSLDTLSIPRQGSQSAPPHPERRFSLAIVSTPEPPVAQVAPVVQIQLPAPQPVIVEEAPPESLNSTFEYWLNEDDVLEVNAVVCVVDAATQVSRPPSAASSPRPLVGLRIEAIVTGAEPVFQASFNHAARSSPPPSTVYPDSAPRVRRRPPQTLFVRRHTRSLDEPLLPPLLTDRCIFVCFA